MVLRETWKKLLGGDCELLGGSDTVGSGRSEASGGESVRKRV